MTGFKYPQGLFWDYLLLVTLAAIFGASFMMTKLAVVDVPPSTIAFARILIAALIMFVVMRMAGENLRSLAGQWKIIFLAGLFGNALPFTLISWGQVKVDAGLTAILMAVMPLITIGLAHFFTVDEKLNFFKIAGFCLGLIGVVVLIGVDKLYILGDQTIRQYAIMIAAGCYAIHAIIIKYLTDLPRQAVSAGVLIVSAVYLLPISFYLDQPWGLSISALSWSMLILLGVFPTAVGTLMLFSIAERQGASFLSQINFLVPVFGILWAVLLIHEVLPGRAALALVIILVGVAIARIKTQTIQAEPTS